jgi:multidrug resistance efflux pump
MKVSFDNKKTQDPARVKGVRVPYAAAKRNVSQWRWYLILLVVASPLLYLLWKLLTPYVTVSAPGYISLEKVSINSTASGIVDQIHVQAGDLVVENQVVVTLYNPGLLERQQVLRAERETLGDTTGAGQASSEAMLKKTIDLSRNQVSYQEALLKDVQFLYSMGAATIAELNHAKAQRDKTLNDLILAEGNLALIRERRLQDQARPDRDRAARQQTLTAEMDAIDRQLRRLSQRVHKGGRVLDVLAGTGEAVSTGTPLLSLGQAEKPYAVVYLDPRHARYARKGNLATVRLPNGEKIRAVVRENAGLTRRIPADISSPISARDIMIILPLDLLGPLPLVENVDGLPISARFRQAWWPKW